jgi:hypothetical protein
MLPRPTHSMTSYLPIFSGSFIVYRYQEGMGIMVVKVACFCDRGPNVTGRLTAAGLARDMPQAHFGLSSFCN